MLGILSPMLLGVLNKLATEEELLPIAYLASTGDDDTAVLGDEELPFETLLAATEALIAAFPGQETTVILQTHMNGNTLDRDVYCGNASLILDGAGTYNLNSLTLSVPATPGDATLIFKDITAGPVTVDVGCSDKTTQNFGIISNVGDVNIPSIDMSAPGLIAGNTGTTGTALPDGTGSTGTTGAKGESFTLTGGVGGTGGNGKGAWSFTLDVPASAGTVLYTSITGTGCSGGNGGPGGSNTSLTGGTGGQGAPGFDDMMGTPADGSPGGDGGDCILTGGDGGPGGDGGDGSIVTCTGANKDTALTIASTSLTGGMNGFGGTGGTPTANAGSGGAGGDGVNGGNPGANGNSGSANSTAGSPGSSGNSGNNGNVIP
jgi:hypothetical protein